jgi:hypothetical protein
MELIDQASLFSMFHDGILVKLEKQEDNVLFQVDIQYIAELINPNYECLNGYFKHCSELVFIGWSGETIFDLSNLEENENIQPDIMGAEAKGDLVEVYCSIAPPSYGSPSYGGFLKFKAEDIKIFDQDNNPITLQQIREGCTQYWRKFSKGNNL